MQLKDTIAQYICIQYIQVIIFPFIFINVFSKKIWHMKWKKEWQLISSFKYKMIITCCIDIKVIIYYNAS